MRTELQRQHERHKAFHASIAKTAARISPPKPVLKIVRSPPVIPAATPVETAVLSIETEDERAWTVAMCAPDVAGRRFIVPTIAAIQRSVCEHYRVLRNEITGPCREAWIIKPRFVAMYLCRQLARRSWPYIGKQFGGRDHSTVINAFRKCELRMARDQALAADIELIASQFVERA